MPKICVLSYFFVSCILQNISKIFDIEKINEIFNEKDIDKKINILQTIIENSNNELTKLEIREEEFENQLEEKIKLEEEQELLEEQLTDLKENSDAIELVRETIESAYERLKENIKATEIKFTKAEVESMNQALSQMDIESRRFETNSDFEKRVGLYKGEIFSLFLL